MQQLDLPSVREELKVETVRWTLKRWKKEIVNPYYENVWNNMEDSVGFEVNDNTINEVIINNYSINITLERSSINQTE